MRRTVSGCRGFRRCGTWALGAPTQQLRRICLVAPRLWDPHGPGINPCPLHRQVDSEPPDRGTFPRCVFLENSAIADQFTAVHLFCDSWAPWVGIPTLGGHISWCIHVTRMPFRSHRCVGSLNLLLFLPFFPSFFPLLPPSLPPLRLSSLYFCIL